MSCPNCYRGHRIDFAGLERPGIKMSEVLMPPRTKIAELRDAMNSALYPLGFQISKKGAEQRSVKTGGSKFTFVVLAPTSTGHWEEVFEPTSSQIEEINNASVKALAEVRTSRVNTRICRNGWLEVWVQTAN